MARAADMAERLPQLWRDGDVVRGLLSVLGLQLEVVDQELAEVARAHHFDPCLERDEAAGLAGVLDIGPEPWQTLAEYRPWVHALRDARLRAGSVTREGIRLFVEEYRAGFEAANGVTITVPVPRFERQPLPGRAALVENPPTLVRARVPSGAGGAAGGAGGAAGAGAGAGGIEPLARFEVVNGGLDPVPLAAQFTGLGSTGPEHAPLLANLTTGEAIAYLGPVGPGARLALLPASPALGAGGSSPALAVTLEGVDVTHRARFMEGFAPGPSGPPAPVAGPPRSLTLARGANDLWFLPLAHFDVPGLDRVLLALAELSLRQGRWDSTTFDRSVFAQEPAATLQLAWAETAPATFVVDLPAAHLLSGVGSLDASLADRDRLASALGRAVPTLAAAGVRTTVRLRPHTDRQPAHDRLAGLLPLRHREAGPTGADNLIDAGGTYGVTPFDDSTFR